MVDFKKLKEKSTNLSKLTAELNKLNSSDNKTDDRFWYPGVDKAGNGYAIIRFLPAPGDEEVPFIRVFEHGFKGPTGQWYIENSLTTIGKTDPVSEYNTKLWNSGFEADKAQAREQKRKQVYISNVLVIQDSAEPKNNGKVFLFKYGPKIFAKITEAMSPQFEDEKPLNPFDLWAGANFKIKIRNVEGYRNYDKSEFDSPEALFEDDDKIEVVYNKTHSLQAFLSADQFKSYDELKAKLNKVLGIDNSTLGVTPVAARTKASTMPVDDSIPWKEEKISNLQKETSPKFEDDDDDDLGFFQKLAE